MDNTSNFYNSIQGNENNNTNYKSEEKNLTELNNRAENTFLDNIKKTFDYFYCQLSYILTLDIQFVLIRLLKRIT